MYVDVQALAAQRDERKNAFMEMLTQDEQIAFNKLRQMRQKEQEPYVNNYDENACELIDFMYYLDQAQFAELPAASMLNLDQLTGSGSRLNPQRYGATSSNRQDTLSRSQGRMNDLDVPTVKRQSELEGWGMGPQ